ncbi:MAG: serine/threonine protein kinase [Armatimonadetes bacterium]|nr:serine/threonine protein kinase [Armatimonadota bacterium]MDE2205311.1 serine/threonine protein kinase [Armatimonadota bacterium]
MAGVIEKVGKYELLKELGHGATSVVYLGQDTILRRQVALKRISADVQDRERILGEARLLLALQHPNIVRVHSADATDTTILIDMEYISGGTVKERLISGGAMPWQKAVRIATQVLAALEYAHGEKVLHRDIKPANILLTETDDVRLADFGVAELVATHGYAAGAGTFAYMAPEDFDEVSHSDCRSDLWAVGITLYEMLTLQRPFIVSDPRNLFVWSRAIRTQIPLPIAAFDPSVPALMQAVLDRAMERDRSLRYGSAAEFSRDLNALLEGKPVAPATISAWELRQVDRGKQTPAVVITTRSVASEPPSAAARAEPGMLVAQVPAIEPATMAAGDRIVDSAASDPKSTLQRSVHLGAIHAGDTRGRLAWVRSQSRAASIAEPGAAAAKGRPQWLIVQPVIWRRWVRLLWIRASVPAYMAPEDRRFDAGLALPGSRAPVVITMQVLPMERSLREAAWWFLPLFALVMAPMVSVTVFRSGAILRNHLELVAPPIAAVTGALALMLLLVSISSHLDPTASSACAFAILCGFGPLAAFALHYGGVGATASLRHGLMAAVLAGGPLLGCCLLQVFYPARWRMWAAAVGVGAASVTVGAIAALNMLR